MVTTVNDEYSGVRKKIIRVKENEEVKCIFLLGLICMCYCFRKVLNRYLTIIIILIKIFNLIIYYLNFFININI